MPTPISVILSSVLLSVSAVLIATSITTMCGSDTVTAYVEIATEKADIEMFTDTEEIDTEDYEHVYEFNRYARSKDGSLFINAISDEDCTMSLLENGKTLVTEDVVSGFEWNPEVVIGDGNLILVISYGEQVYSNTLLSDISYQDPRRTKVTAVPGEIVSVDITPAETPITQYSYYSNGYYVDTEILVINGVRCVHIMTNCDISKSYYADDYRYPVVIGYTDNNDYNMILGSGDKKNVPDNVKIINNMFSLGTTDHCTHDYFTYENKGKTTEIYVPLGTLDSELLDIGDKALIVPSASTITVQINSNLVQRGRDNTHAVLVK